VDEWEAKEQFPSHEVFKKLGNAGLLGVNKPVGNLSDEIYYE
jgi:citronellyl-CoA dehydrogenase